MSEEKKPTPSTNVPLLSLRKSEQLVLHSNISQLKIKLSVIWLKLMSQKIGFLLQKENQLLFGDFGQYNEKDPKKLKIKLVKIVMSYSFSTEVNGKNFEDFDCQANCVYLKNA